MPHLICPSLLAADFGNLERDINMINDSDADWLHIDIMDGVFVPNISYGQAITKRVNELCTKPLDVHLMIVQPERYIASFRDAGADIITVHAEACDHLHRVVYQIKESGAKAGVALNPHTPVSVLENLLEDLDLILLMSVNPGFGGQKFIYQTINKVRKLQQMLIEVNSEAIIEVDGGVGLQNAEALLKAGTRALVAGSSIFKSADPRETITKLKSIGQQTLA